jgi:HEAT repeat protein
LRTALADADWRVACEAAGALGQHPEAASIAGLAQALEHPSPHVRRVAAEALGAFQAEREAVRPLLERARVDASPNVRIAAIESQARLGGDEFAPEVKALADRSDPLLRAGAAAAAVRLSDEVAVPILVSLTHDPNLRVADIAARGLKEHPTKEARARILSLLENADNGLRLAAAETLGEIGEPVDLPALQRCLASTRGEIAAEVAANVVDAAAKIGGEQADLILKLGASHEDPFVRKKARAWLARTSPTVEVPRTESRSGARPGP